MNTPWLQCRSRGRDDDVGVVQWRRGDAGDEDRWGFPSLAVHPRDRTGLGQWVATVAVEPRDPHHWPPHLLFIALRDGGPPATSLGWASPIRTRD
jgi:hypothetical protein